MGVGGCEALSVLAMTILVSRAISCFNAVLMIMLLFLVFLFLLIKNSMGWRDFSESFAISILKCERKRRLEK